jgi:hypothetical protein
VVGSYVGMSVLAVRGLSILVVCVGVAGVLVVPGSGAPRRPGVVAIVGSADRARLTPVDPRTLTPLPGAWSVPVPVPGPATLSPSGKKVAVQTHYPGGPVLVVDTATGRVEHTYGVGGDTSTGLYWFDSKESRPLILAVGFGCGSTGVDSCGAELSVLPDGNTTDYGDTEAGPALEEGLVLILDPTSLDVFYNDTLDHLIDLPRMPPSAPFAVVADVTRDRLFAVSSGGLVAEIDHVGSRHTTISYHTVDLNGQPFQATWAGAGNLALWGRDGLGFIDTHGWTTRAVATAVSGAVATPLGLAAWTRDPAEGLSVYRSDGGRRLHLLVGKSIHAVRTFGDYLYVSAGGQYSVDLRTGKVFGPLANRATVVTPTLASFR